MLENTISIDLGAETGVILNRINQDQYSSEYYGEATNAKIRFTVKHDIPARGMPNESHLVRLDVEHYTVEGAYMRTSSAWMVIKTFDSTQDSLKSAEAAAALNGVTTSAFLGQVIGRIS